MSVFTLCLFDKKRWTGQDLFQTWVGSNKLPPMTVKDSQEEISSKILNQLTNLPSGFSMCLTKD